MTEPPTNESGTLPDFITSPSETWAAAVAATKDEAVAIFQNHGWDITQDEQVDDLTEVRLARAPVPSEYVGEFPEWFEVNPQGQIVAWEMRF